MRGRADVGLRYICLPDSGGRRNNPDAFPAKAHFTSGGNLNMGTTQGSLHLKKRTVVLRPRGLCDLVVVGLDCSPIQCRKMNRPRIAFRRRSRPPVHRPHACVRSPQALCHRPIGSPGHPVYHAGRDDKRHLIRTERRALPSLVHEVYSICPNSAWELHSAHELPQVATQSSWPRPRAHSIFPQRARISTA
jgi:hypothetical protein